jgi:hypothetical protein
MQKVVLHTFLLIALTVFTATRADAGWREDMVSKTNAEAADIAATASMLENGSIQCSDHEVSSAAAHLDAQADRLAQLTAMAFSPRSGAGERYIGQKTMIAIRPIVTDARFTLADALLKASCLDEADKIYRETITTFTGSAYDALRQRAEIGINDVRSKRAQ